MSDLEHLTHACGHSQQDSVFGPERVRAQQRAYYQGKPCCGCDPPVVTMIVRPTEEDARKYTEEHLAPKRKGETP